MQEVLKKFKSGLIVSCQALQHEPLYSSYIMQRMAVAAMQGGAVGIRANSVEDILEIRKEVPLPVIGIIKKIYHDSQVYITPTMSEVDALAAIGVDIIAVDATKRTRPNGIELSDFFKQAKEKYPKQLFMADCSNYEEALRADRLGFDIISTTLCGCTPYTQNMQVPDYRLLECLVNNCKSPVIAEGGIWEPEQLKQAMATGILAAVIGTAITRPMDITKRFVAIIQK